MLLFYFYIALLVFINFVLLISKCGILSRSQYNKAYAFVPIGDTGGFGGGGTPTRYTVSTTEVNFPFL